MTTNAHSILTSVKTNLGIAADYTPFDEDIMTHINSVFGTLNQLGLGPTTGFEITGADEIWSAFLDEELRLAPVKSYVYLRVRMLFDPSPIGFVLTAMTNQIQELEWRLMVMAEEINTVTIEDQNSDTATAVTSEPLEPGELLINTDSGDVWVVL